MRRATTVEMLKLRRSPVMAIASLLMVVAIPVLASGFNWVAENGGTGALAVKANALVVGEGWEAYLGIANQIAAAGCFVGAGVVVAWMFGREHADRTFPSLFAQPVSRTSVAAAKFVVLFAWTTALSTAITIVAFLVGIVTVVAPVATDVAGRAAAMFFVVFATCLLATTVGVVASAGRGYLPAIGVVVVILAAAQVSVLFGSGGWFPYSVPGLVAIAGHEGVPDVSPIQISLIPITTAAGALLTLRWWNRAEVGA